MKYTSWCVAQLPQKGKPWQAILKYKDENGKWHNKKKTLGVMGKKEAERLTQEWFYELNAAAEAVPEVRNEKTVDEVVRARLDYQLATGQIEKSTYRMYVCLYEKNVEPYLGGLVFSKVDRLDLESWIAKLHNKGLSQNTIYNCYTVPKSVYSYYHKIGEIDRNPFTMVSVSKGNAKQSHMTQDQMDKFLQAVYLTYEPEEGMYAALLIMFYGALRRQEVCGLRWRDIDFTMNTLTVSSAVGVAFHETYMKNPKNKSSKRTFPMLPQLREALELRYKAIKPEPSWFVCGEEENYMPPSTLSDRMRDFVKENDLVDAYGKSLSSHMLRHNVGMMGIKSGMDISSLSKMFGHASRSMTLDRYGDYSPTAARIAAEKLGEKFDEESFFKKDKADQFFV